MPEGNLVGSTSTQGGVQALNNISLILKAMFGYFTGTSSTATAGSATLPSAPASFATVVINGTQYKVPLYNP